MTSKITTKEMSKEIISNLHICKNIYNKKAFNQILNYINNNNWKYFFVLKIYKKISNIQKEWNTFKNHLQKFYPTINLLTLISNTKKLKFYGLIGNADLSKTLVRAINNQPYRKKKNDEIMYRNGKPIKNKNYLTPLQTKIGDSVYSFRTNVYNLGFSYIIPLLPRNNSTINELSNYYIVKYMKNNKLNIPFKNKSFFHTNNLNNAKNNEQITVNDILLKQSINLLNNKDKELAYSYITALINQKI